MRIVVKRVEDIQKAEGPMRAALVRGANKGMADTVAWLSQNSPRGVSPPGNSLRSGWTFVPTQDSPDGSFSPGFIKNTTPFNYFRIVGRGPGLAPPVREGSSLSQWAIAKGLPPYVVARSIARRGTARWRAGAKANVLNIDPLTGKAAPGGEARRVFDTSMKAASFVLI